MRMRKAITRILVALCVLALCAGAAHAEMKTTSKTVRGKGYGATPEEAVQNALVSIIQQNKGVSIDAKQLQSVTARSTSAVVNGEEVNAQGLDDQMHKQVALATKGVVSNYRVIDQGQGEDRLYWAEVETVFSSTKYQTPGLKNDRRLFAVYPFSVASQTFPVSGRTISGIAVAESLTDAIIAHLVQSRKFGVLQRRDLAAYAAERSILTSSSADKQERLKLGRLLGADYMLVGAVNGFAADTTGVTSSLTGERLSGGNVEINVSYELMLMATQQIKWADTLVYRVELPPGAKGDSGLQGVFDGLANTVVLDLLENIYPPEIVAVQGNEFVLNMGGKSFAPGDRLDVYARGSMAFDPHTREPLGPLETLAGAIEITRVTAKVAYARAIPNSQVAVGMVCRRMAAGASNTPRGVAKTPVTIDSNSGGVKLPFDN
jgi:TolB-like protein